MISNNLEQRFVTYSSNYHPYRVGGPQSLAKLVKNNSGNY